GPGLGERAKESAGRNGCAQQFSFKPFSREISYRHRAVAQQTILVFSAEPANSPTKFTEIPQFALRRLVDVRRRHHKQRRERAANARKRLDEVGIALRVASRQSPKLARGSLWIFEQTQRAAIRIGRKDPNRRL